MREGFSHSGYPSLFFYKEVDFITTYITALILSAYIWNPLLTLSQASVESHLNQFAKGSKGSYGAFQVRPKVWGKVPEGFYNQSQQYQGIMQKLVKQNDGDLWEAVERYNGSGKAAERYVEKVKKRVLEVALL